MEKTMRILIYSICIAVYGLLPVDIQATSVGESLSMDKAPDVIAFVNDVIAKM